MEKLDLPDDSVDAVVSRMGALLVGDPVATAQEMAHVLKPGGQFSIAAWAEAEVNPYLTIAREALLATIGPDRVPDLREMFGSMAAPRGP